MLRIKFDCLSTSKYLANAVQLNRYSFDKKKYGKVFFASLLATTALTTVISPSTSNAQQQVVLEGITVYGDVNEEASNPATSTPGLSSTSITTRELEISNPSDLADVFQAIPGVTVGSSLPISQKIYVNGIEETNLNVTIDGSRQNNKVFHHNSTTYIDPDLLKSVNIYAGVAPADVGPGALGGSIAFETKDVADLLEPGRTLGGFIGGQYETNGEIYTVNVSGYGRSDGFEILGAIKYADGGLRQDGDDNDITGSKTDLISGLGKLAYQGLSGDRLEVSYETVHDAAARPYRADMGRIIGGRPVPLTRNYDLQRTNYVFSYTDETPTGLWDPKVKIAYSATDLELTPEPDDGSETILGKTDSFNGKVENRFAFGQHSLTAGFDFYKDSADYSYENVLNPSWNDDATEKVSDLGVYAQARLEPMKSARISFGGRFDQQWFEGINDTEIETSGLSGNVSGELDITSWLTVNAGYSHIWAGIVLAENFIMNSAWSYANGIEDTVADNYVAGLKFQYESFTLLGRVFKTNIDNARAASWSAGPSINADVHTKGYDISGEYKWNTGFLRLAYADINAEVNGISANSYNGRYLTTPVGQIITAQIVNTFSGTGITAGVDAEIALENTDNDAYQAIPGYEVVNAFLEYKPLQLPNVTLRLDAKNLFDQTFASRATYGQEYPSVVPLYEPGRSFKLSAKVKY